MTTWYLGLATTGHDPSMALVDAEGTTVFAQALERYMQDKRAWGVAPDHAAFLETVLADVGAKPGRDRIVVATSWKDIKPALPETFKSPLLPAANSRALWHLQTAAQTQAGHALMRLGFADAPPPVQRFDHHLCHAATAVAQSQQSDATCVVLDGEGEVGAVSVFDLRASTLKRRWRSWGPGSLGTFYGWLTEACGFQWYKGEEWKVMGLAAYGEAEPDLVEALCALVEIDRGRLRFASEAVIAKTLEIVAAYKRGHGDDIMRAATLAASGQQAYARMADAVLEACLDGATDLILTGGCALNSSYNGTIKRRFGLNSVFVPSAPGDDGNAIGAALLAFMNETGRRAVPSGAATAALGSCAKPSSLTKARSYVSGCKITDCGDESAAAVSKCLQKGQIIGVMRGNAEFGPRALGQRSILADPRDPKMKDRINLHVKGREAYRPFAPVIPEHLVADWFDHAQNAPYMSFTLPWRAEKAELVPAVVHEDGTGRLQSVNRDDTPWLFDLAMHFGAETGVPVILNTSFNIMGKPIVHSVEDAVAMFMTSGLDCLLIEDILFEKQGTE